MRRIYYISLSIMLVQLIFVLCSCSNSEVEKVIPDDSTSLNTSSELSQEVKKGSFRLLSKQGEEWVDCLENRQLSYHGNDLVLRYEAQITSSTRNKIDACTFVLIDGKRVPFSMDDSSDEEVIYHTFEGKQQIHELRINLDQVPLTEQSVLTVVTYSDYNVFPEDISYAQESISTSYHIAIQPSDEIENHSDRSNEVCSSFDYFDDTTAYYTYITTTPENPNNYHIKSLHNQELFFNSGILEEGSYTAMLFLDGKPINGFDGKPYLEWDNKNGNEKPIMKQIDPAVLPKEGKHIMSSVVINRTKKDGDLIAVCPSQLVFLDL